MNILFGILLTFLLTLVILIYVDAAYFHKIKANGSTIVAGYMFIVVIGIVFILAYGRNI